MDIDDFISRWRFTEGSERANKDSFLKDLCRVLGVPEPDGRTGDPERDTYVFEADAVVYTEGERRSTGKMDLYRRGCFVVEAKQCASATSKKTRVARRGAPGWHAAMEVAPNRLLVVQAAAEALAQRRDPDQTLAFFAILLDHVFGVNAAGRIDAKRTLEAWSREYRRRVFRG